MLLAYYPKHLIAKPAKLNEKVFETQGLLFAFKEPFFIFALYVVEDEFIITVVEAVVWRCSIK